MNKKINVRVVKKTYNSKVGSKKSTHNVTSLTKNVYSYKFKNNNSKINVSARSGIIMARKLSDLLDVDTSNLQDNYVMLYDAASKKYKFYDPSGIIPNQISEIISQINDKLSTLKFGDLIDVDDTNTLDKYIIMYNEIRDKYITVNPDEVLKASVDETTQEGLPDEFLDQLDVDLDNRIDFDGGEY